jgi:N-acetylglucosamine-6-phosphate deacetylase
MEKNLVKIIKCGILYTPYQKLENSLLVIVGNKIFSLGKETEISLPKKVFKEAEIIDAEDKIVCPGFIDIHVHGGAGHDFMEGTPQAIESICKIHAKYGTTSLLFTTLAAPHFSIISAIEGCKKFLKEKKIKGSKIAGIYIESPYISQSFKGAQNPEFIRNPNIEEIREIVKISGKYLKVFSLAPELPGAEEVIRYLKSKNIVVSAGHTGATYQELVESINWGVSNLTHFYCGMSGLHHRSPGVVGAGLLENLTAEIIADGHHVHSPAIKILVKMKGVSKIISITDCIQALGLEEGEYQLGGLKIIYKDGAVKLNETTLAGSVLTMNKAVENMVKLAGLNLREALFTATVNPARILRLEKEIGSIGVGKYADIVIMDTSYRVKTTIVEGEIVYFEQ